jgi:hypothetical protein
MVRRANFRADSSRLSVLLLTTIAVVGLLGELSGALLWLRAKSNNPSRTGIVDSWLHKNFEPTIRYVDAFNRGSLQALAVWAVFSSAMPAWRALVLCAALGLHVELDQFGVKAGDEDANVVIYLVWLLSLLMTWRGLGASISKPARHEECNISSSTARVWRFSIADLVWWFCAASFFLALVRGRSLPSQFEVDRLLVALPILVVQPIVAVWIVLSRDSARRTLLKLLVAVLIMAGSTWLVGHMNRRGGQQIMPVDLARRYHHVSRSVAFDFATGSATMLFPLVGTLLAARLAGYRFQWRANHRAASGVSSSIALPGHEANASL